MERTLRSGACSAQERPGRAERPKGQRRPAPAGIVGDGLLENAPTMIASWLTVTTPSRMDQMGDPGDGQVHRTPTSCLICDHILPSLGKVWSAPLSDRRSCARTATRSSCALKSATDPTAVPQCPMEELTMSTPDDHSHHEHYVHVDPLDDHHHGQPADVTVPVDRVVFTVGIALTVAFVAWGVLAPESLAATATAVLGAMIDATGWVYVLVTAGFVALMLLLAASRYGRIRLGRDDERPEFSTGSWISMMFATGMGIGLIFWGVAEPLSHLLTPPMGMAPPASPESQQLGMQ